MTYYPPWVKEKEVIDELWATIKSLGETDDWIKEQIEAKKLTFNPRIFEYWGPTSVPMDHELVKTMSNSFKDATGREATLSGSRYVSDATYLGLQGIPAIIFGPGDINYGAHGIDEFVPVNEVINCAKTIALTLIDWCQV